MRSGPGGVVAVVAQSAAARSAQEARRAATAALGGGPEIEVVSDRALVLAWLPGRYVHVVADDAVVCLVSGSLYVAGGTPVAGDGAAAAVAATWRRSGDSGLGGLRGEFWAVVWDRERQGGVLFSDQLGTRSPFWREDGGELLFAGEVAELLDASRRRPGPDPLMIAHWLQASHAPAGRTLYESVQRLPGGHRVLLGAGPGRSVRYWLPRYAPPWQAPRDELVARLRETLGVAVDRRLTDARRPGVLLSGGIDSSAVSAVAAARGRPLHGVSALFPDHPSNDESELIDATTRGLRMPSTRMVVRASSVLAGALDYLARWQLPPTTPNMYFWTPLMQEAAAAGIDVMLDGEGGDETFFLSPYLLADRLRRGRLLSAWRLSGGWTRPAAEDSATLRRMRLEHYGIKGAVPPLAHTISRRVRRPLPRYVPGWIRPDVAEMWLTTEQSAFEWKRLPGPRWWAWLVWAITQSVGPALVYEHAQRRTGGAGIDARHPLVDVDVVELMLRMPPELSFEPVNRPLLRDAVSGVLPEPVRTRPAKSTFDESFHAGLIGFDLQVARRLLGDGHAAVAEYVDVPRAVEELLDEVPAPGVARMGWGWRLWRLLTCECWLRTLDDREFPERLARTEGLALPEFESGGSAAAPRP